MGKVTDPLYLPLKRGGPVCTPLESPMISNEPEERSVKICAICGRHNYSSVGAWNLKSVRCLEVSEKKYIFA